MSERPSSRLNASDMWGLACSWSSRSGAHTLTGSPSGHLLDLPFDLLERCCWVDLQNNTGSSTVGFARRLVGEDLDGDPPLAPGRALESNVSASHTASRSTPRDSAR